MFLLEQRMRGQVGRGLFRLGWLAMRSAPMESRPRAEQVGSVGGHRSGVPAVVIPAVAADAVEGVSLQKVLKNTDMPPTRAALATRPWSSSPSSVVHLVIASSDRHGLRRSEASRWGAGTLTILPGHDSDFDPYSTSIARAAPATSASSQRGMGLSKACRRTTP
jgi:hypothetical protein